MWPDVVRLHGRAPSINGASRIFAAANSFGSVLRLLPWCRSRHGRSYSFSLYFRNIAVFFLLELQQEKIGRRKQRPGGRAVAGWNKNMPEDTIDKAEQIAEQRKQTGAGQIDDMAKAVRGAADELQGQMPKAAEFMHAAASRLEQGAGALRERSIQDLVSGFNDFGRREPLMLFGGALVAGFAISRFLKSSADHGRGG